MDKHQFEQQILHEDIEQEMVDLICELIPIGQPECANSLEPEVPGGIEKNIALHVKGYLERLGLSVETSEAAPDRPNVISVWKGTDDGPTLILNDHLDTYPSGEHSLWTETGGNPYRPTVKDRYIYGRGTSDTRGNLAVILMALKLLKKYGAEPSGQIVTAFTVDEEKNGKYGACHLLNEYGIRGDYEITCEPSGWTHPDGDWGISVALAHSGHCLLDLTVQGTSSHLWRPDTGINANDILAKLILALPHVAFTYEEVDLKGPTGPVAFAVRIEGGKLGEGQFTPPYAKARIAVVGLVPGMSRESVLNDLQAWLRKQCEADSRIEATIDAIPGETFVAGTREVPRGTLHLEQLIQAYELVLGEKPNLYRKNAYCDTIRFAHAGIPALTFGPGEDGWDPINERIHIDKVVAAVRIMTLTIFNTMQCRLAAPSSEVVS
jgi:acetylornithine deacetylase